MIRVAVLDRNPVHVHDMQEEHEVANREDEPGDGGVDVPVGPAERGEEADDGHDEDRVDDGLEGELQQPEVAEGDAAPAAQLRDARGPEPQARGAEPVQLRERLPPRARAPDDLPLVLVPVPQQPEARDVQERLRRRLEIRDRGVEPAQAVLDPPASRRRPWRPARPPAPGCAPSWTARGLRVEDPAPFEGDGLEPSPQGLALAPLHGREGGHARLVEQAGYGARGAVEGLRARSASGRDTWPSREGRGPVPVQLAVRGDVAHGVDGELQQMVGDAHGAVVGVGVAVGGVELVHGLVQAELGIQDGAEFEVWRRVQWGARVGQSAEGPDEERGEGRVDAPENERAE
ncbi:hypothetical protein PG997_010849 [Apiospora hydei]|uniref:Uncharacterized protein n=1 Tax=Apiospora hydei TaxID=1337664 RepID=A0ABR1VHD1_9PEZI